ncbi:MAG TPA: MgtC/SapB family protein [Gemmatimonadaceae bacterium]|nr:MgtC/SapB family protein [Gemmatimonadaceae bacterium]
MPQLLEIARILRIDLLVKLALAVLLGGIIGFERELAGKPAGLRTNILICIGAALLMDVSTRVGLIDGHRVGDPGRIAAQIVSGIGFLGAGTILQGQGVVTGLTSAATIWVVAAIGMTVGAGFYIEGIGAGLLVTFVLAGLGGLERWVQRARRVVSATVRTRVSTSADEIAGTLRAHGIRIEEQHVFDHEQDRTFELKLSGPSRQFPVATSALLAQDFVYSVHVD